MFSELKNGFLHGVPIMLGYLTVSFTFGLTVVKDGMPWWMAVLISASNLTSAGQFAGASLMLAGAGLVEIAVTVFVINIRYMLMSLSLSQKLSPRVSLWQKLVIGFGVTDEIFAVASTRPAKLTFPYMMGLIAGPFLGWTLGTLLGSVTNALLPAALQSSMGIALYAMFIAIIVPPSKKSRPILLAVLLGAALSMLLRLVPVLTDGWIIILAAVAASAVCAALFPAPNEEGEEA